MDFSQSNSTIKVLTTCLILLFANLAVGQNDYPYSSPVCSTCNSQASSCGVDPWGMYKKQCVSYIAWRINRDNGITNTNYFFKNGMYGTSGNENNCSPTNASERLSNACRWDNILSANGYLVSSTPTVGAIAQWNAYEDLDGYPGGSATGYAGHVAYVEAVNSNGSVNVSEYNISSCSYGTRNSIFAPRYIRVSRYRMEGNITINPNPIRQGQSVTVSVNIKNNHSATVTTNFRCALYTSSNQYVGDIQIRNGISFAANETKTLTFTKSSISSNPGSYKIWIESSTGTTPWVIVHKTNASSPVSVEITSGTSCNAPTGQSVSNITPNSAQINWSLNSSNTQNIVVEYRQTGSPAWVVTTLPANFYYFNLTGLIPSTSYEYRLKRICTGGSYSPYSNAGTFTTSPGIVNNGIYKLTRKGSNKVLDAASCGGAGANVQLWDDLNNDCQKWVFQRQSDGSYEIKAKYNTGLNLDVLNCLGAGANVRMWNDLNNNCQRWILEAQSDGSYEIKNKNNLTLNLDAQSCGSWAGTNVQVWTDNNENCQRWMLTYLGIAGSTPLLSTQENRDFVADESKVSFEIIPNPTSGYIKLKLMDTNATGEITIQIHDMAGRLIETLYSGHADNLGSDTHYDTSHLHGGTYLVVFSHAQGREIKRLVVVR
jgi:surface antigen